MGKITDFLSHPLPIGSRVKWRIDDDTDPDLQLGRATVIEHQSGKPVVLWDNDEGLQRLNGTSLIKLPDHQFRIKYYEYIGPINAYKKYSSIWSGPITNIPDPYRYLLDTYVDPDYYCVIY